MKLVMTRTVALVAMLTLKQEIASQDDSGIAPPDAAVRAETTEQLADTVSSISGPPVEPVAASPIADTAASVQQFPNQASEGSRTDSVAGMLPDSAVLQTNVDTGVTPSAVGSSGTPAQVVKEAELPGTASSEEEVRSLDRMVVAATRTRRRISETPASVSVVSREDIEVSAAKDVNDLIANETGVQARRVAGMGEGVPYDIIMRGIPGALAATRVLVLVDGIPTNASGTPFLILNEIPNEDGNRRGGNAASPPSRRESAAAGALFRPPLLPRRLAADRPLPDD